MKEPKPDRFCEKHGGDLEWRDAWLCNTCARAGIDLCKCGSHARYFGEALMQSVSCESCDERVAILSDHVSARKLWNDGVRGWQADDFQGS